MDRTRYALQRREGFDVNNICVIVPLRTAAAKTLLEQTIGRGLRLMWRGNEFEDMKRENRDLVRNGKEPHSLIDVLSIVEHPAFQQFYNELPIEERGNRTWHYALVGEAVFNEFTTNGASMRDLLHFARLRDVRTGQQQLIRHDSRRRETLAPLGDQAWMRASPMGSDYSENTILRTPDPP